MIGLVDVFCYICVMSVQLILVLCVVYVVQGLLSFLSAPLIGALSDIWGRKPFLLLTVTFTCVPIPLMKFSPWSVAYSATTDDS